MSNVVIKTKAFSKTLIDTLDEQIDDTTPLWTMLDRFLVIEGWMIDRLGLMNTELLVYALILGFTKAKHKGLILGTEQMAMFLNKSKSSINTAVTSLTKKGFIHNYVPRYAYVHKLVTNIEYLKTIGITFAEGDKKQAEASEKTVALEKAATRQAIETVKKIAPEPIKETMADNEVEALEKEFDLPPEYKRNAPNVKKLKNLKSLYSFAKEMIFDTRSERSGQEYSELYKDFLTQRVFMPTKKPITGTTVKYQIRTLNRLSDPRGAIENTIANGWQGFFEPRGSGGNGSGYKSDWRNPDGYTSYSILSKAEEDRVVREQQAAALERKRLREEEGIGSIEDDFSVDWNYDFTY